ncbi:glycine betaine ABC transporter substrate-binding protein [uncultured Allobaculum sp.]|uniref:glycine betaine ABC transporter substrate-binding protein n=1 Tax=uncultured Allobaculum sp. TaxID=1187017 RepID=UPI00258CC013|nr:glycine betaine ABC transporter substrate-binding protein [uncultured Allobaculum sp.]
MHWNLHKPDANPKRKAKAGQSSRLSFSRFVHRSVSLLICLMLTATMTAGCAKEKKPVRIGMTDSISTRLVGWMVAAMAEHEGIECIMEEVPGGISNLQPPLESDKLQIGVELAQSAWKSVLNERGVYTIQDLSTLEQAYDKRGLDWFALDHADDKYTIAISKSLAKEKNIQTLSNLAKYSDSLVLGAPTQYFQDADGYPWLNAQYGNSFKTAVNLPTDLTADALRKGKVDAIPIHTLDGLLRKDELYVLEDDLNSCPQSQLGVVITQSALEQYPELSEICQKLSRELTGEKLTFYGRLAVYGLASEEEAALQFLKARDLIVEDPAAVESVS